MYRRAFITAMGGSILAAPFAAEAQHAGTVARIGMLMPGTPSTNAHLVDAFRQGLRELGYVEGQNIVLDPRYAGGRVERFAHDAAELARLKVDVIVAAGPMIEAAMRATNTIPIVMSAAPDPIARGFVASLPRPGGNVTGLSLMGPEIAGKLLQLVKEIAPKATRVGVLNLRGNTRTNLEGTEVAARTLGLQLVVVEAGDPDSWDRLFETAIKSRVDALIVFPGALGIQNQQRMVQLAARYQIPAIYQFPEFVVAGGLMSYGASLTERYHRAAAYVDKILKGVKPGDLPVEQPTKFELVINLKTAKALGLTIPQSILVRADEIIR